MARSGEPDRIVDLQRRLGRRLAELRLANGRSQQELAVRTFIDRTYISHAEHGRSVPDRPFWEKADAYLTANGGLLAMYDQLTAARHESRLAQLDELRARLDAPGDPRPVPEEVTLNAHDAIALLRLIAEADMDRRYFIAITGSALTAFAHDWLFEPARITQSGTGRRVGPDVVDGLDQIAAVRRQQHDELGGSLELLNAVRGDLRLVVGMLEEKTFTEAVSLRLHAAAAEFARIAGNVAFEGARFGPAQRYYLAGLRAAHISGDRALGANVLVELTGHALAQDRPREAMRLAESAVLGTKELTPAVAARVHGHLALAAARAGEVDVAERAAATMHAKSAAVDPANEPAWLYWWSERSARQFDAWSALYAGQPEIAATRFEEAIAACGLEFPVERARDSVLLAFARLRLGELEGACGAATEAVDLIRELEAGRVRTLLGEFRTALEPHAPAAAVMAYHAATAGALA